MWKGGKVEREKEGSCGNVKNVERVNRGVGGAMAKKAALSLCKGDPSAISRLGLWPRLITASLELPCVYDLQLSNLIQTRSSRLD